MTAAAYTLSTRTFFNGFASDHPVVYINSESQTGDEEKILPLEVYRQDDQSIVV